MKEQIIETLASEDFQTAMFVAAVFLFACFNAVMSEKISKERKKRNGKKEVSGSGR